MVERVAKQQRPLIGLQQIAGMINAATTVLGKFCPSRQALLQKFIDEYVKRYTERPKEKTGFVNLLEVFKVIRKPFDEKSKSGEIRTRSIVATLISIISMWRGNSLSLMTEPENNTAMTLICSVPYDKTDKTFDGLIIHFLNDELLDASINPYLWVQKYLSLTQTTRTRYEERFPDKKTPLFVPISGQPITQYLSPQTLSNGMQSILTEANQITDQYGDKIMPSSWRGSTQQRLRRCNVPDVYIEVIG